MRRFIQVAGPKSSCRQNVVELVEKLVSFADLPTGWCYGDGVEITQGTIARAQDVLAAMLRLGASRLDVIPTIQNQAEVIGSIGQCVVECFAAEGRPFEALVEFGAHIRFAYILSNEDQLLGAITKSVIPIWVFVWVWVF